MQELRLMAEQTTLSLMSKNKTTLRTVIPSFIVKQFGFKNGDRIEWTIESIKGESVIVIRELIKQQK